MVKESNEEAESRISVQKKLETKVLSKDISDILEGFDRTEKENCIFLAEYFY